MMHGLTKNSKWSICLSSTASASGGTDGLVLDRQNYESVVFFGSVVTTATDNGLDVYVSTSSSTAQGEPVKSSRATATSTALLVDCAVLPPGKRYVYGSYRCGTATKKGALIGVLYNPRKGAVDNATSTQAYTLCTSGSTGGATA